MLALASINLANKCQASMSGVILNLLFDCGAKFETLQKIKFISF